jgi:hypothetical protein
VARVVFAEGDEVGARMAFKEAYGKAMAQARQDHRPHAWTLTEGFDPTRRAEAVRIAAQQGRPVAGAEHLLALPDARRPPALLEGPASASAGTLPSEAGHAIARLRQLLASRRDPPADPGADSRSRTTQLRAETAARAQAYAKANGVDFVRPTKVEPKDGGPQ